MITKSIVTALRANPTIVALAGSSDRIFAETGSGSQLAMLARTSRTRVVDTVRDVYAIAAQLFVSGYGIESGEELALAIIKAIEDMEGARLNGSGITYEITAVVLINGPVLIRWQDDKSYSANLRIAYKSLT